MKTVQRETTVAPVLPNNKEAERSTLGAVLMDNKMVEIAGQHVEPEDFFFPAHIHIFAQMITMREKQMAIDLVTLTEECHRAGELELVGGAPYLASLVDGMPRVSNVEHYARIVKEKAILRRLIHASAAIQQDAFEGHQDAAVTLDCAETRIRQLRENANHTQQDFFDTFAEFETAPPLSFAIEGFLQNDAITGIAGLSGHGKTWLGLAAGRALLHGPGHLWDLFPVPERAKKVIYLIPESTRTPFKHRLQLTGLYDEIRTGRLLVRTLSKGCTPSLTDASLLREVKRADIIIDTAVRFMGEVDESSGTDIAEGLSKDFLDLLRADARTVVPLFHSPKSFAKESAMSLEGMIRGSSEFGAVLACAWGVKQIDDATNTVHIQNLKPRDFDPCGPFQIVGRPFIDQTGDFQLLKRPGECGTLAEEQGSVADHTNDQKRDERIRRVAIVAAWQAENPNLSSPEMVERFKAIGITVDDSTVRHYRTQARKGVL
jgi:DnaB-like helicase N terminal domain/AAA domain